MNNFEKIKNMNINEMKNFFINMSACDLCVCEMDENSCMAIGCEEGILKWLLKESEIQDEK